MTEEKSEHVKKLEELGFQPFKPKKVTMTVVPGKKKMGVRAEDGKPLLMDVIKGLKYPWFMIVLGRTIAVTENEGKWIKDEEVDLQPYGFTTVVL